MAARCASEVGEAVLAEATPHVLAVKRLVVPAAQINALTRVDLEGYLRRITSAAHSLWWVNRLRSLGMLFETTEDGFRRLSQDLALDAHNANSAGTYLIVVVFREVDGPRRLAWYVGEASDQAIAERQAQHDASFAAAEAANYSEDFLKLIDQGQRALYRAGTIDRFHITLTSNPAGPDIEAQAEWLAQRFFDLFGKRIDLVGGQTIPARLLVKMATSVDELIAAAFFDTVWRRFPLVSTLDGFRFGGRTNFLGVNGQGNSAATVEREADATQTAVKGTQRERMGKPQEHM